VGVGGLIIAAIFLGIAISRQRLALRVVSGLLCSFFTAAVFLFTRGSLWSLFTLQSITSRMSGLWFITLKMMEGPIAYKGLGLGCWPLIFYKGAIPNALLHVHNLYLEIYANLGVFGIIALVAILAAVFKVSADILYSDRKNPYYGFGVGVILAIIATLVVGFVESAPLCIPCIVGGVYHFVFSPIPWFLMALLITAQRLLRETAQPSNRFL
jgi:hypothetical protein